MSRVIRLIDVRACLPLSLFSAFLVVGARTRAFRRIMRRSKYISGEKCYATRAPCGRNARGHSRGLCTYRGEAAKWQETVTSAHATPRRLYLHAKVHFVQVYNYGFRGRYQFRRTRCWGVASGTPSLPSSLPLRLLEPHQPDQPFGGSVPLSFSAFNYFAPDGIYA